MSRQTNYRKSFISIIEELGRQYPTYGIGRHISTALADYGDFWGITDKEFCFALEKYASQLQLDENNIVSPDYVEEIIEDGKHLFDQTEEEEEF